MLADGITYGNITHVLLQLAYFMGFTLMLCVGLDNTNDGSHFYGAGGRGPADLSLWDDGYRELRDGFATDGRRIINLSTPTRVTALERADWREYV